jgi:hypothetical protein
MFSLPFVFKQAGLGAGFFYMSIAALIYVFIHLMYADVIVRTKESHRFVGYAKTYLGPKMFWPAVLMTVVEMIFVLAIYLVLSQSFADLVYSGGDGLNKILIFWLLGSSAIFLSLKRMALLEFLVTSGMALIIVVIFYLSFGNLGGLPSASWLPDLPNILLPLAPILFALAGRMAIPSLVEFSRSRGRSKLFIKRSIIWGTLLPVIIYVLFVASIIALSLNVSPDAVSGLVGNVPVVILSVIGVVGLLSLFSSYILAGLNVADIMRHDLIMPRWLRTSLVVGGPLFIYLIGFQSFIGLVGLVGGVFLAFEGTFIVLMWLKANKTLAEPPQLLKPIGPLIKSALFLVFAVAIVYEIIK